jgi:hypothetical protein
MMLSHSSSSVVLLLLVLSAAALLSVGVHGAQHSPIDTLVDNGFSFECATPDAGVRIVSTAVWYIDSKQYIAVSVVFSGTELLYGPNRVSVCQHSQATTTASRSAVVLLEHTRDSATSALPLVWATCLRSYRSYAHTVVSSVEFVPTLESAASGPGVGSHGESGAVVMLKAFTTDSAVVVRENNALFDERQFAIQPQGHFLMALTLTAEDGSIANGGFVTWSYAMSQDVACIVSKPNTVLPVFSSSASDCSPRLDTRLLDGGTAIADVLSMASGSISANVAFANDLMLVTAPYYHVGSMSWHVDLLLYRLSRTDVPHNSAAATWSPGSAASLSTASPPSKQLATLINSWHIATNNLHIAIRAVALDADLDRVILTGSVGPEIRADAPAAPHQVTLLRTTRSTSVASPYLGRDLLSLQIDHTITDERLADSKLALHLNWRLSDGAYLPPTSPAAMDGVASTIVASQLGSGSNAISPAMPRTYIENPTNQWLATFADINVSFARDQATYSSGVIALKRLARHAALVPSEPVCTVRYTYTKSANATSTAIPPSNSALASRFQPLTVSSLVLFPDALQTLVVAGEIAALAPPLLDGNVDFLVSSTNSPIVLPMANVKQPFVAIYTAAGDLRTLATLPSNLLQADASITGLQLMESGDIVATLQTNGNLFLRGVPYSAGSHLLILSCMCAPTNSCSNQ